MRLRSHETGERENVGTVPSRHACRVARWGQSRFSRLRLKWLWFRHMGPVLFAHKPLCKYFTRDVIRIGSLRVCRSCACLYAGVIVAAVTLGALHAAGWHVLISPLLLGLPLVLGLSMPPIYRRMPRFMRDLLRFATGGLVAGGAFLLFTGNWQFGLPCLLALFVAWRYYRKVRRSLMSDPCLGCPELEHLTVCSGYAPQAERFRSYEEEASELISVCGYVPKPSGRR